VNGPVHVIDDDEAVRESLAFLLEAAGFQVTTSESATLFLERLTGTETGCIVTDVRMPGLSGLDLARILKARGSRLPLIVITGHGDVPLAVEAMKAGAQDFIEKPFADDTLIEAIRLALASRGQDAGSESPRARIDALSTREHQVLKGLVAGKANKVIARDLGISPRTVEIYRAHVMTKMRAASLSELVRLAILAGEDGA
jgi:two-component system response regulator FixJ